MIFSKSEFDLGIQFWALTSDLVSISQEGQVHVPFRQKGNGDLVPVCFQQGLTLGLEGRSRSRHGVLRASPQALSPPKGTLEPPPLFFLSPHPILIL